MLKAIYVRLEKTKYAYNARGQQTSMTDANNKTTTREYDNGGRLTKETNAKSDYTEYGYDLAGNRTSLKYRDSNQVETTYTFYKNNLLKSTTYPGYSGSNLTTNVYDKNGNLISKTDGLGNTTTFTFDLNNRMTLKDYPGTSVQSVAYTYDASGNVLNVTDANTDTDSEYDDLNRLIAVTDTIMSKSIVYGYNEDGTRSYMDGPEPNDTIGYTYDNAKRLLTVTRNGTTEETNTYNALSLRTRVDLGNSSYITYTYNTTTRWLTGVYNNTSANVCISSFEYQHDLVGNRTKLTLLGGDYIDYTYDNIYQLTQEQRFGNIAYTNTFSYDEVGNRLTQNKNGVPFAYTYNDANQLTQEVENSITTTNYTLDANGNTVTKTQGANVWEWYCDYNNMQIAYDAPGTADDTSYTYNAMGARISKTNIQQQTTERYIHDGANIIADYDGSNNLTASYVTPMLDQNLLIITGGNTYYYLADGLGSIRNLIDTNEIVQNTYDYFAFGEILFQTENVPQRYKFTAREWDTESGLQYNNTRYYNPTTGRFTRRDSIGYQGGLNLYSYVLNNPINHTDPFGLALGIAGEGNEPGDNEYKYDNDRIYGQATGYLKYHGKKCDAHCEKCDMQGKVEIAMDPATGGEASLTKISVKIIKTPTFTSVFKLGPFSLKKENGSCCKAFIGWFNCYRSGIYTDEDSNTKTAKIESGISWEANVDPVWKWGVCQPIDVETKKHSWFCSCVFGKWECTPESPDSNQLLFAWTGQKWVVTTNEEYSRLFSSDKVTEDMCTSSNTDDPASKQ